MSGKYALILANTEYTHSTLAKLAAPGKDAEAFAAVLEARDISAFDEVKTLVNESEPASRRAIAKFFANRTTDDLLLLYFSGHGVRNQQGRLFLATPDTDPDMLDATAIPAEFVTRQMEDCRSKRQILILDCCNSGAFAYGTKAVTGGSMGTGSAFEGKGYGHVVLTATDATQFAWEGDQIIGDKTRNSLFTHYLIKGLEGEADKDGNGAITVDELYDYAYDEIVRRTPEQTPGKWTYKEQGQIMLTTRVRKIIPQPPDPELEQDLQSTRSHVREGAVKELGLILNGNNPGKALTAELRLQQVSESDDSLALRNTAAQILQEYRARQIPAPPPPLPSPPPSMEQEPARTGEISPEKPEPEVEHKVVSPIESKTSEAEKKPEPEIKPPTTTPPPIPPPPPTVRPKIPPAIVIGCVAIIGIVAVGLCLLPSMFPSSPTATEAATIAPATIAVKPPTIAPTPISKIVYTCDAGGANHDQICLMNADGSEQRQLTSNAHENYYASLSPDGSSVVFTSGRTGNFEIFEADLSGNERQLTSGIGELASPEISPDGSEIVFTNTPKKLSQIWVMDRNGKNPHKVYASSDSDATDPTWSPDGRQILFALGSGENKLLYVVNADGSGLAPVSKSFRTRGRSDWSPDGSMIAGYSGEAWHREIFLMNSDGSKLQQISNGINAQGPSFSPDGKWIAYTAYTSMGNDNACEIYTMRIDGSDINRLTNNNYCDYQPRWGP